MPDDQGGFTGHLKDSATGLNYMQARYYDPVMARFLSVDPVGFLEDGRTGMVNRYSYSLNNPVNMIDPDGRSSTKSWWMQAAEFSRQTREARSVAAAAKKASQQTSETVSTNVGTTNGETASADTQKGGKRKKVGLGNVYLELFGWAVGEIADSVTERIVISIYRVCDNVIAPCDGRSWTKEDPRLMEDWRDRLAVYPNWNAGTYLNSGIITVKGIIEKRVQVPTEGVIAIPKPYSAAFGGGSYSGGGHEVIIPDVSNTVGNLSGPVPFGR